MKNIIIITDRFKMGGAGKLAHRIFEVLKLDKKFKVFGIELIRNDNFFNKNIDFIFFILYKIFFRLLRFLFSTNQHFFFNKFLTNFSFLKFKYLFDIVKKKNIDIILIVGNELIVSNKILYKIKKKTNVKIIYYPIDNYDFTGGCRYNLTCDNYKSSCNNCVALKKNFKKIASLNLEKNIFYTKQIQPTILLPSSYAESFYKSSAFFKKTKIDSKILFYPQKENFTNFSIYESIEIKKKYQLPLDKKIILIGAQNFLEWRKGMYKLNNLLKSYFILKPYEIEKVFFLIIGNNSNIVMQHSLKNFTYYNEINYDQLNAFYKAADIFIIPSIQEWSSLMLSEALSFGKIIISNNSGSAADLITNGYNGFVVDFDDNLQFNKTLNYLINLNPQKFELMKKNAITVFKQKISDKVFLNKFCEIIS